MHCACTALYRIHAPTTNPPHFRPQDLEQLATCLRRIARMLWTLQLDFEEGFDRVRGAPCHTGGGEGEGTGGNIFTCALRGRRRALWPWP